MVVYPPIRHSCESKNPGQIMLSSLSLVSFPRQKVFKKQLTSLKQENTSPTRGEVIILLNNH